MGQKQTKQREFTKAEKILMMARIIKFEKYNEICVALGLNETRQTSDITCTIVSLQEMIKKHSKKTYDTNTDALLPFSDICKTFGIPKKVLNELETLESEFSDIYFPFRRDLCANYYLYVDRQRPVKKITAAIVVEAVVDKPTVAVVTKGILDEDAIELDETRSDAGSESGSVASNANSVTSIRTQKVASTALNSKLPATIVESKGQSRVRRSLEEMLSPYRIDVLNRMKNLLSDSVRLQDFSLEIGITQKKASALIFSMIKALLFQVLSLRPLEFARTAEIIRETCQSSQSSEKAEQVGRFFYNMSSRSDLSPGFSTKYLVGFSIRFADVYGKKSDHFFSDDIWRKFQKDIIDNILSKYFEEKYIEILTRLAEAVLPSYCNAFMLKLRAEAAKMLQMEAEIYALMAYLIAQTFLQNALAQEILTRYSSENASSNLGRLISSIMTELSAEGLSDEPRIVPTEAEALFNYLSACKDFCACYALGLSEKPKFFMPSMQNLQLTKEGKNREQAELLAAKSLQFDAEIKALTSTKLTVISEEEEIDSPVKLKCETINIAKSLVKSMTSNGILISQESGAKETSSAALEHSKSASPLVAESATGKVRPSTFRT